jgi:hypothetical protein
LPFFIGEDMDDKESKSFRYRFKVDEEVAEMYAKSNCKECFGKGVVRSQQGTGGGTIRRGGSVIQSINYCQCVRKNQRKYG